MHILIIEDEEQLCRSVAEGLRIDGYETDICFDGDEGLCLCMTENYDLILLDLNLPGTDGLEILRQFREHNTNTPVLILSARDQIEDKVSGLDLGANDYLTKPFGMMEMVSRIRAVLRRTGHRAEPTVLRQGGILLDEARHAVEVDGSPVTLTLKEYDLLRLFMENPGLVFTRDRLLSAVWGADYYGETRTVDVHIGTLRTKLGPAGDILQTVRGVGYKLEAPHE